MSNLRNLKSEDNSSATTSTMSISSALLQIHERINKSQETLSKLDEVHAKSKSLQSLQPTALDIDDLGPNHLLLDPFDTQRGYMAGGTPLSNRPLCSDSLSHPILSISVIHLGLRMHRCLKVSKLE